MNQNQNSAVVERVKSPVEVVADWLMQLKRQASERLLAVATRLGISSEYARQELTEFWQRTSGDIASLATRIAQDIIEYVAWDSARRQMLMRLAQGRESL